MNLLSKEAPQSFHLFQSVYLSSLRDHLLNHVVLSQEYQSYHLLRMGSRCRIAKLYIMLGFPTVFEEMTKLTSFSLIRSVNVDIE